LLYVTLWFKGTLTLSDLPQKVKAYVLPFCTSGRKQAFRLADHTIEQLFRLLGQWEGIGLVYSIALERVV